MQSLDLNPENLALEAMFFITSYVMEELKLHRSMNYNPAGSEPGRDFIRGMRKAMNKYGFLLSEAGHLDKCQAKTLVTPCVVEGLGGQC